MRSTIGLSAKWTALLFLLGALVCLIHPAGKPSYEYINTRPLSCANN